MFNVGGNVSSGGCDKQNMCCKHIWKFVFDSFPTEWTKFLLCFVVLLWKVCSSLCFSFPGSSGGICEKSKLYSDGKKKSLNTGIITVQNYASHVPPKVSHITFAHEVGHNFGSPVSFIMCHIDACQVTLISLCTLSLFLLTYDYLSSFLPAWLWIRVHPRRIQKPRQEGEGQLYHVCKSYFWRQAQQ